MAIRIRQRLIHQHNHRGRSIGALCAPVAQLDGALPSESSAQIGNHSDARLWPNSIALRFSVQRPLLGNRLWLSEWQIGRYYDEIGRRSRAAITKPPDRDAQCPGLVGEVVLDAVAGEDDDAHRQDGQ